MSGFAALALLFVPVVLVYVLRRRRDAQPHTSQSSTELPTPTDTIEVIEASDKTRNYTCGHRGPTTYTISVFGEELTTRKAKKCPACSIQEIAPLVIRCARCRLPMFPGDAIALYDREFGGIHQDITYWVGDSACGCMRFGCVPAGVFFAGYWNGTEFEPAFGGLTLGAHTFKTGETVVMNLN